jgi:hypothetical protein
MLNFAGCCCWCWTLRHFGTPVHRQARLARPCWWTALNQIDTDDATSSCRPDPRRPVWTRSGASRRTALTQPTRLSPGIGMGARSGAALARLVAKGSPVRGGSSCGCSPPLSHLDGAGPRRSRAGCGLLWRQRRPQDVVWSACSRLPVVPGDLRRGDGGCSPRRAVARMDLMARPSPPSSANRRESAAWAASDSGPPVFPSCRVVLVLVIISYS